MSAPIKLLENYMNYLVLKKDVISKNIANVGTENYKREDVAFQNVMNETLKGKLRATEKKHFGAVNPGNEVGDYRIVVDDKDEAISGVNNVDIDKEMSELAETTLLYKFTSRKVSEYFKTIQEVIRGGR